ncbi:hypothetical protein [Rhodohalobacter mucosus]|uniref:Uncharacterized protein n=1 Tax=Rhodohalobacter mucosus TaxID=2079485 RepID=A0A316TUJ0_9BACT|nr:hypothetical protein [Rhodohalobacter mucosus]PWN06002.1 hypothetical protein DDZ15_12545 [Rhodohalobacter mucosus]
MEKKPSLHDIPTDELKRLIKNRRLITLNILIIFAVIILAWIFLGYWRENLLVFISTIVIGVSAPAAMHASSSGLRKELRKRLRQ